MTSINQMACEFIAKNPLCTTNDVANHISRSVEHTSKILNRLELTDHVRVPTKTGRYNRWIVGTNRTFQMPRHYSAQGNGGGVYYPQNGSVDRKRVVTVTTNVADAMALLKSGFSKMKVA